MPQDFAQLTITLEGKVQQTLSLTMDVLRVGRTPNNELVLADREVSRDHAEFKREANEYRLTDLGSTNGTSVNDAPLSPHVPYLLHSGDRIKISRFLLIYEAARPAQTVEKGSEDKGGKPDKADVPAVQAAAAEPPGHDWVSRVIDLDGRGSRLPVPPRPTWPVPLATGPASRYLNYLPAMFGDDDFLGRYLLIIESIWEPLEQRQHHINMYFDPQTAPASFLRWLGAWVGLELDARWPEKRCRELLSEAMDLYRFRGTLYGLKTMIELFTGISPEIVDAGVDQDSGQAQPFVFRVKMKLPEGDGVDRQQIEDLIDAHKPAHAGYVLEIQQ